MKEPYNKPHHPIFYIAIYISILGALGIIGFIGFHLIKFITSI